MKHLAIFSTLLTALCLSAPVTGWSDDKDKNKDRDKQKHHDHGDRHHHSHYRHYPSAVVRPVPYYRTYPSYSYYSRPSVGLSITTRPSYSTYYRSQDYNDGLAVDVQRALARRGYYRGEIDGDVGPGTRSAIRQYQYRNRLEVTGRIDRTLLRSLGLS